MVGVLVVTALCTGCGDDDKSGAGEDEQAVKTTIEDLERATRARDASRICEDIYAADAVRSLERKPGGCEGRVEKAFVDDAEGVTAQVAKVTVSGDRATALVRSQSPSGERVSETVRLVKADDQWRILVAE